MHLARMVAAFGSLAVLVALPVPAAVAVPAPPAAPGRSEPVTLITGDTVTLTHGATPTVSLPPGRSFATLRQGDDLYVVPDAAAHLVPDVLDLELFNVTGLADMGYGATDTLPVIMQGPTAFAAAGGVALPSIGAVAVDLPKQGAVTLASGTRIWLDGKVRASELDRNLTAIGAPEVWAAGLTGAGVDVAVLDTGVDGTHADLRGKVVAEADFTESGSAADENGHGTHVASIVAGTGAAAAGARKGVAHDARLLNGRVLDARGRGQASWVIAGMEWAAAQGADVINMSLGGQAAKGDDPLAQALDALTASTGALFVVAAGNDGPSGGTIGTPGVAASALTVGAAAVEGGVAYFSSRGPTLGTFRGKPDLTAPGVGIVGALAGSGDGYLAMEGTSQAAPHVAGAAALLRQQHPDWDWQRIKTVLMTTADAQEPAANASSEGAGILDLPGATTDTVRLDRGAVDFGYLRYPNGTEPRTIELTITNDGTAPQELSFSDAAIDIYGVPAPDDVVTVEPAELTVDPGASARVTATLTPPADRPGVYSGAVTMTGPGREPTSLPLGFYAEAPRHDIALTVLNRHGEPDAGGTVWLGNMAELHPSSGGGFTIVQLDQQGKGVARIAPGPVSIITKIETPAAGGEPDTVALAGSPEVMVDKDIAFTIDARQTRRVDPATVEGQRTTPLAGSIHYARHDALSEGSVGEAIYATAEDLAEGRIFLQPTAKVRHGTATFETRWQLAGRSNELYSLVLGGATVADPPVYRVSRAQARNLARLDSDYRTLGGLDETYVDQVEPTTDLVFGGFAFGGDLAAPTRRVEFRTAEPGVRWRQCVGGPRELVAMLCAPTESYRPGERRRPTWFHAPAPSMVLGSHNPERIQLPVYLSDGEQKGSIWNLGAAGNQSLRLFRDGVELPRFQGSDYFDSPPEPAMFRLEHTSTPDQSLLPIGSRTSTTWTFPSQAPTDPDIWETRPRLLTVDYQPHTDAKGRLAAWTPVALSLRVVSNVDSEDEYRLEHGGVRVWLSADQGKRWHEAFVVPRGNGTYVAGTPWLLPRPGQAVSVRVSAKAAEGRSIDQTIIDAYPVR